MTSNRVHEATFAGSGYRRLVKCRRFAAPHSMCRKLSVVTVNFACDASTNEGTSAHLRRNLLIPIAHVALAECSRDATSIYFGAGVTIIVSPPVFPVLPASPLAPSAPFVPLVPSLPLAPVCPLAPSLPEAPGAPAGPGGPGTTTVTGAGAAAGGRSHADNADMAIRVADKNMYFIMVLQVKDKGSFVTYTQLRCLPMVQFHL